MKAHVYTPGISPLRKLHRAGSGLSLVILILLLSSCYKEPWYGRDGAAGNAYLSITWADAQPEYLDAGTGDIPPVFEYGRYYLARPGFYTMYYEGRYWNGQALAFYAWEVDYEVWAVAGERGGLYYNGARGADNYFTIECSPYGPWVYGPGYKTAQLPEGFELIEESEEKITISKESSSFGITISYKKQEYKK